MRKPGFRKYGNQTVIVDGMRFDSLKEARRWGELRLLEKGGDITDLQRQVKIELQGRDGPLLTRTGRKMKLTVDFTYIDKCTGLTVYEDAKGAVTRDYEVRKSVAEAMGIPVVEV